MTPIERLLKNLVGLIFDTVGMAMDLFQQMDTVQMATFSICVLVISAMCLRGTPVRGA